MTRSALTLLVAIAVAGCTSDAPEGSPSAAGRGPDATATPTTSRVPTSGCRTTYPARLLPPWAREGFTAPRPSVPHVLGDDGDMVAILWDSQRPLAAPPVAG